MSTSDRDPNSTQADDKGSARARIARRLHRIEDKAVETLHTIDDHNARELREDVQGVVQRFRRWFVIKVEQFRSWYGRQPIHLKIAYGCTLVPAAALLGVVGFVCVKFAAPILLIIFLGTKLGIAAIKLTVFIGYIGYKIIKTILMWYYIISRSYTGHKARRARSAAARDASFSVRKTGKISDPSFRVQWKNLFIRDDHGREVRVLFSYLRYAMIGQMVLLKHLRNDWKCYLTLWKTQSREQIKLALAPVGASIFTPHTLGPDVNETRILVLGDAQLDQINIGPAAQLTLQFTVRWVQWQFKLRAQWKFLLVRRIHYSDVWTVDATPVWSTIAESGTSEPSGVAVDAARSR